MSPRLDDEVEVRGPLVVAGPPLPPRPLEDPALVRGRALVELAGGPVGAERPLDLLERLAVDPRAGARPPPRADRAATRKDGSARTLPSTTALSCVSVSGWLLADAGRRRRHP